MRAYHDARGERRKRVIIPDSAHGTNPASVTLSGFEVVTVGTNARGGVDLDALRSLLDRDVAGIMLTNPSTLGTVRGRHRPDRRGGSRGRRPALLRRRQPERDPRHRAARRHGLRHRAPERAQDLRHAPRRRRARRRPGRGHRRAGAFPPWPAADAQRIGYGLEMPEHSIGRVHSWHGNALVLLRAWMYLRLNGGDGLKRVSEVAVLNANWLKERLRGTYDLPYDRTVMHECVMSAKSLHHDDGAERPRRRKAPHRARLPPADGVLPPHRRRGAHDRAHRDREPADAGGPRRRVHPDRRGGRAAGNADDAKAAPRTTPVGTGGRGPGGPQARRDLRLAHRGVSRTGASQAPSAR